MIEIQTHILIIFIDSLLNVLLNKINESYLSLVRKKK